MNTKYHRLNLKEREEISKRLWNGESFVKIAEFLKRSESTISREVWKNIKKKLRSYQAVIAEEKAREKSNHGRPKKITNNKQLQSYIHEKLFIEWSPEEIAKRIKKEYPKNIKMRISHETIYQYLYCLPRGELKKELMKGLRQERKMRQPRQYAHYRRQKIQDIISISERPKETASRRVPGHWEGDLIVGKGHKSAIGTLVERTTRLTLIVPLDTKDAFGVRAALANIPVSIIQRWMGHSHPVTTAIYLEVRDEEERKMIARTWL